MNVAVCFATWNKAPALRNTLAGLLRQEMPFPWRICVVDDGSDDDSEQVLLGGAPRDKLCYERLASRVGFAFAQCRTWDLMPDDVDTVVLMSSDVVMLEPDCLLRMCRAVAPGRAVFAEVVTRHVPADAHEDFRAWANPLREEWLHLQNVDGYCCTGLCGLAGWLFYCGAIRRADLEAVGFRENCCDAVLAPRMKKAGYEGWLLRYVRAVHQAHEKIMYPCPIQDTCNNWCSRTSRRVPMYPEYPRALRVADSAEHFRRQTA